jgi:NAD+ kinase
VKAILFINLKKNNARLLAEEIAGELAKQNIESAFFTFEGKADFAVIAETCDIAFSLGGDGTVLYAARAASPAGVPVFPINLGTLGFIAAVHPENWKETFSLWLAGKAKISRRLMLEVVIERQGREVFRGPCLNDAVISASGIAKLIRLKVYAGDGDECMNLGQYRSDGLIVATPTGSTGYSVAAGGPILDPQMEALILNPICPFTLSNRPIVLPAGERVLIEVEKDQRSGVLLTVDGQITFPLEPEDAISISRFQKPAMLIASDRGVFYHALKTKLSWMGAPNA